MSSTFYGGIRYKDLLGGIFPWALGMHSLTEIAPYLLNMKLSLWKAIDNRAFANKYSCEKVGAFIKSFY